MKKRQFRFKNFATEIRILKDGNGFMVYEYNSFSKRYLEVSGKKRKDYESAVKEVQRYSKKYYGEKAV